MTTTEFLVLIMFKFLMDKKLWQIQKMNMVCFWIILVSIDLNSSGHSMRKKGSTAYHIQSIIVWAKSKFFVIIHGGMNIDPVKYRYVKETLSCVGYACEMKFDLLSICSKDEFRLSCQ